jgi:hypothetical protein
MYITGTFQDYATRIHQFASQPLAAETGVNFLSGLNQFIIEGSGYILNNTGSVGLAISGMSYQWEREARISKYRLTQSGTSLTQSLLSTGIII